MSVPKRISLQACSMCQLRCTDCDTMLRKHSPGAVGWGYLKFDDYKRFLENHNFINEVELSWLGEIFLNPDIRKIIKYSFEKGITLKAEGGVNLNTVSEDILHDFVKYKFAAIVVAIDGATQRTYEKYRQGGNLENVFHNIMTINKYKKKYNSEFPVLSWQFIVFWHNKHEVVKARKIARLAGMKFFTKMPWREPLRSSWELVREKFLIKKTGPKPPEFIPEYGVRYPHDACRQLWLDPQLNWDGNLFGCCRNKQMSFGNVFELGLEKVMNSEKYWYTKEMLAGRKPPREDIMCNKCSAFQNLKGGIKELDDEKV